jgi:hypothetical protein
VLAAVRPWAPNVVVQAIASMSFIGHFQRITDGVFEASALVFFPNSLVSMIWSQSVWAKIAFSSISAAYTEISLSSAN